MEKKNTLVTLPIDPLNTVLTSFQKIRDFDRVIYYLHGIYGSERSWKESNLDGMPNVRTLLKKSNRKLPPIVSISFGRTWLVTKKEEGNKKSGLYEEIMQNVFPYLEKEVLKVSSPIRIGLGMSMGGFNMSQLYLHSPHFFQSIALVCPAMSNVSPYASANEIWQFIIRTKASSAFVLNALWLSRQYFTSEQSWQKHSPLAYLAQAGNVNHSGTDFYLSANDKDDYGFQEGDRILYKYLREQGVKVKWEEVPGHHCIINEKSVSDFLLAGLEE